MPLWKRSDPVTGETIYRYDNSPADAPPSPEASLGGQISPIQGVEVFADRVEIRWSWCHSSGQAELYIDGPVEVFARSGDGCPAALLPEITKRFGADIAAEVESLLKDPTAFATQRAT